MARILVVDDNEPIRNLLNKCLSDVGADVTLAVDGIEGLKMARNSQYDLIITDLDMPRMDGFQLCKEVKLSPPPGDPPIIIMSAYFSDAHIENGFRVGAWGYVPKYNLANELLPRVRDVLHHKRFTALWRVLVVDSSKAVSNLINQELSAAGFQVNCVENGMQALEILRSSKPDLIISDLKLPDMDDQGLLGVLKKNKALNRIPFLVLSYEEDQEASTEMLNNGASAYLMKPFKVEQLVTLVGRLITHGHRQLGNENDALAGEFQKMFGGIADLVKALEARVPFTTGHSQAVADLSLQIGEALGLANGGMEQLNLAARLHDLGKIGLGDSILLKPSELSPQEYQEVKQHPVLGAKLLEPFTQLSDIVPAVFQHHERYDGSGYPSGLKGKSIDPFARIIAVSDVYDALTNKRPYRDSMDRREAIQVIKDVKGSQLCPECVSAFISTLENAKVVSSSCVRDDGEYPVRRVESGIKSAVQGKVVVIVDGSRLFFKGVAGELKARGAKNVVYASDGEKAWNLINLDRPDLLICEWDVAGLTTRQLLEKVAWSEDFCKTHTIITTTNEDHGQLAEIVDIRPSSILSKPFSLKDLFAQVEKLLGTNGNRHVNEDADLESVAPESLPEVISLASASFIKTIHAYSEDALRLYKSRFCRFFPVNSLPTPMDEVEKACSQYQDLMQSGFVDVCEKRLSSIGEAIGDDEALFRQNMAEFVTESSELMNDSSVESSAHFQEELMNCLSAKAEEYANDESINWLVSEFRIDISDTANQFHDELITSLNNSLKHCQDLSEDDCKLVLQYVVDAFGRGLLEPLNELYPIVDSEGNGSSKKKCFSRQFCAPVLNVVRSYLVGHEKYDKANKSILESVRKFMGKKTGFDPDKLRVYFSHPKIRQYYVSSILYCLKKMASEVRRENFIQKVNNLIVEAEDGEKAVFDIREWNMLSESWAQSVQDNLGDHQKDSKAVEEILEKYLSA